MTNVIWNNLGNGLWRRKFCTALIYGAIFWLVFFWTVPVGFISSLIALQNIAKVVPFLEPVLNYSAFVRGIIEGFLASVVLWVFFAVLPLILEKLTGLKEYLPRVEWTNLY
ncbi:phosphate metabolism protein 7 [Desmophyllum pertusum]|uniref:Phosphate metabolism protein 7 n=1 Tax=Desmophyllum pertusum TaxID=174260 RepID=A0A9W9YXC3_9CNID|nr:phosphate metabolism protein 7 [Desmophyllum pertusum]